jgi:hypothetical protein
LREVQRHRVHARAERFEIARGGAQTVLVARADREVASFARKCFRARTPKAFARRTDNSGPSTRSEIHRARL